MGNEAHAFFLALEVPPPSRWQHLPCPGSSPQPPAILLLVPVPAAKKRPFAPIHQAWYSPPEELVMPKDFPKAPVPALAALLAPFAWLYGAPDLFDSYSAGVEVMGAGRHA
eukprot:279097-Chlamydomonas_euryale.AAC.1